MHDKAERRFIKEIDIVNVYKAINYTKLYRKLFFNKRERLLLKFQKRQALNESSSTDSDDVSNEIAMKIRSKNPFIKLGTFLALKKLIFSNEEQEFTPTY